MTVINAIFKNNHFTALVSNVAHSWKAAL